MTDHQLALIAVSVCSLVGGQVFLKLGMKQPKDGERSNSKPRTVGLITAGIALMTVWFMVWLGLMQEVDLSRLFPFEGLATVLLSLVASAVLRERTSARMWVAVVLISAGVALVGSS